MMRKYLPIGLVILIVSTVIGANYLPHTWLLGWDNLMPELNFSLNIERSLFAVWQEYQGLGLLGGMGHAADLPRQLMLWATSIVVPAEILRYAWTFGMLTLGTIGCYFLLEKITRARLPATIGALFYLLNLATIQMFYAPFEAFTTHFGFLPWLVLTVLNVFDTPSRKNIASLALVSLLSSTQAYVPTVFVVWLIALFVISIGKQLKKIVIVWAIILCTNAFWLIPFSYFTATNARVTVNAKINQIATDVVYLQNRAYGSIIDTVQLKGFWFDTWDFNPTAQSQAPLLSTWRSWANQPFIIAIDFFLFAIMLWGAVELIRKKETPSFWVIGLFIISFTMLTTATPPFSWVNDFLRMHVPLFAEVFRFPFTKFSIVTAFSFSLLLGTGVGEIFKKIGSAKYILFAGFTILLVAHALPLWQGKLFYSAVERNIPTEYRELFTYLNRGPTGRIVNLPQPNYWGWTYTQWGYTGSGFVWYGIQNPILDRAFDVWSNFNENYYWELSRALYSKNAQAVSDVLNKYDISYIVLDENVTTPDNYRSLFIPETKTILAQIADLKLAATFGKISVYKRTNTTSKSYVSVKTNLPTVNAYSWTDNDVAYSQMGDYISEKDGSPIRSGMTIQYPYRSLFTKRSVNERDFDENSLLPLGTPVYDSTSSADLSTSAVKVCGLVNGGKMAAATVNGMLQFDSQNDRGCLSYDISKLSHANGYLVAVESAHIAGQPLMISFINDTAKHVEEEAYLPTDKTLKITYFVLPPLAADGLGYNVYVTNDSIGQEESINELKQIRIYEIPYNTLVNMEIGKIASPAAQARNDIVVSHPNPAFYKITLNPQPSTLNPVLILSQSYDSGWLAYDTTHKTFLTHVEIDNWENGWTLNSGQNSTIYIIFWPQLLEFIGFALLPIPFILKP